MCSQPIEHEAQLSRAIPRASARSSAASRGASENVAAWKFRVGSVAIALKASRFASVPSSRYFAVAGPNERVRRSRAASSTARGSAEATFVAGFTATAFSSFEPRTAPSPPRPAWRPSCETVAYLARLSPAGPIEATRHALPSRSRSLASASAAGSPQRSPAGSGRRPPPPPRRPGEVAGGLEPRPVAVDEQHGRLVARAGDDDRVVARQLAGDREVARGERVVEHPRQRRLGDDRELRARRQRRADERGEAEGERGLGR